MRAFTIHETKTNQLGTFSCRILFLEYRSKVLLIRPCLNPLCPDLGFRILRSSELAGPAFSDQQELADINLELVGDMLAKLAEEQIEETDKEFSNKWFDLVAELTELRKYQEKQQRGFSSLLEDRE